jgi:hypothetical protein
VNTGSPAGGSTNYGIYCNVLNATTNYAVYARSKFGTDNWGLYSDADKDYFSGNVGIGTTDIGAFKLKVEGTTNLRDNVTLPQDKEIIFGESGTQWKTGFIASPSGAKLTTVSALRSTVYGGSAHGFLVSNNTGTSIFELLGDGTKAYIKGNVGVGTTNPTGKLQVTTLEGAAPSLYVTSAGNVGIGTTNPGVKLEVNGPGGIYVSNGEIRSDIGFSGYHLPDGYTYLKFTGDNHHGIWIRADNSGYGNSPAAGDRMTFREWGGTDTGYHFLTGGQSQTEKFRITDGYVDVISGKLGVGYSSTPSYQLQISTDSAAKPNGGSWANPSDIRLKTDVTPITDALDKLTKLQGVRFKWKNPAEHGNKYGLQGGFIAQDLEKVFPGWVQEVNPMGSDNKLVPAGGKVKSLSLPFEFDAMVVESIKELKKQNDELRKENEELKARLDKLEEKLTPAVGR